MSRHTKSTRITDTNHRVRAVGPDGESSYEMVPLPPEFLSSQTVIDIFPRSTSVKPLLGRATCGCTRTRQIPRLPRSVDLVCCSPSTFWPLCFLTCGLAVAIPGELRGWEHLHQQYGKLPWAKLFEGAIKLARHGFTVNEDLAAVLNNGGGLGPSQNGLTLTRYPQPLTRSCRPIRSGRKYMLRMAQSLSRETLSIGRSLPRPSNCRSHFLFHWLALTSLSQFRPTRRRRLLYWEDRGEYRFR